MKRRTVMLGALIALLLSLVLFYRPAPSWTRWFGSAQVARMPVATDAYSPFHGDTSFTLDALRDRALTAYRLGPDTRFLGAIAEARRLAGLPDSAVTARFSAGRWTVTCGSQTVGSFSELPDFAELMPILTDWARTLAWSKGWADPVGPKRAVIQIQLDRLDAKGALHEADRAWAGGMRDAGLFRDASRAFTLWLLETPTPIDLSEGIAARGLATLAFARALGAHEPARETCLMADVLGYHAEARRRAASLAADDPVRMFVEGNDPALESAAATATTLEAPFFQLVRAARRGDAEAWDRLRARFEPPAAPAGAVLPTGLEIHRFDAQLPIAEQVLRAVIDDLSAAKPRGAPADLLSGLTLGARVASFERANDQREEPAGVLLDPALARAQRRSVAYSALDRMADCYMESLASLSLTRWFALGPEQAKATGAARDFPRGYAHLAQAMSGHPDAEALHADVDSTACGPLPALRAFAALRTQTPPADPSLRGAVQSIARRLDTRPEHRIIAGDLAERELEALNLAERWYRSAAAAEGAANPALLANCARFAGDVDSLRALATRPGTDPWWRSAMLNAMADDAEAPDSTVQRLFEKAMGAPPEPWPVVDEYADWLERKGHIADARALLERWLAEARPESASVLEYDATRTRVARLYQLEGRPEDGLRVLGDLADGQQLGAMQRTALLLQDLGRSDPALAMAWAAHRRYPHLLAGRMVLVELFWRQGRYGQAAGILRASPVPPSDYEWAQTIAPRFVTVFRGHEDEGLKAAQALMDAGYREQATVGTLAEKLSAAGLHDAAFEIESRIKARGLEQVGIAARAYQYLKLAHGEGPARAWLAAHLGGSLRGPLGTFAHQDDLPELLWTMAPANLDGPDGDYYWLMRAAACMEAGPSFPRHAETVQHLATTQGTYFLEIARYLVGLREESQILKLARSMKLRAEIYYFVGLKAEHDGRLRDAADWYLMSVESGAINNVEPRWALYRLQRWAALGRSLDVIAKGRPAV
jgi:tetratricopeptide (TPR) repeat protein